MDLKNLTNQKKMSGEITLQVGGPTKFLGKKEKNRILT